MIRAAALSVGLLLAAPAGAAPAPGRAIGPIAPIGPIAYDLTLAPDVAAGRFAGEETLTVTLDAPAARIRLDAIGLDVTRAAAVVDGKRRSARVRTSADAIRLDFDPPLPRGPATIELAWTGALADRLEGLYRTTQGGEAYVFTQLEPAAARRVFPCFDAPARRARFTLHAVVDADAQAVSNGAAITELAGPAGKKTITFAPTPPISTYLVSLAIGRFEAVEGRAGAVPVRVLAPPGRRAAASAALATTIDLVGAFEGYLGVPFPFAKLDVVAVPHLAPHAMENAGAIFVREDELLVDDPAHVVDLRVAARRLAHELAHQWFGDLVTMAAWNDLWLSEGLARWAEFEILDRTHADWGVRQGFRRLRDHALHLDDRPRAHAIRPPAAVAAAFDPITYDKGAATVRMLQTWMGDDAFHAGLRAYLTTRAYGAASSEDFWAALGGQALVTLARGWFERRGHPRVWVEGRCAHGVFDVRLRQADLGAAPWPVPLVLRTPSTIVHLVLRGARAAVRLREPGGCPNHVDVEDEDALPFPVYARRAR